MISRDRSNVLLSLCFIGCQFRYPYRNFLCQNILSPKVTEIVYVFVRSVNSFTIKPHVQKCFCVWVQKTRRHIGKPTNRRTLSDLIMIRVLRTSDRKSNFYYLSSFLERDQTVSCSPSVGTEDRECTV